MSARTRAAPTPGRAAPSSDCSTHTASSSSIESLLGAALPGVGAARVLADMDAWGYTFRLGSAAAYVEGDADEAWAWLQRAGLVTADRLLV